MLMYFLPIRTINIINHIYTVYKLKFPIWFFKKISAYSEAIVTCNTAMEWEFYWVFGVIFKNCEKLFYEAEFAFFRRVAELEL